VIEVLVHLDLPAALMPDDDRLLAIEIPVDASVERSARTPANAFTAASTDPAS
jgi:hypothetical protein